jgi:hypothetical protein
LDINNYEKLNQKLVGAVASPATTLEFRKNVQKLLSKLM